MERIRWASVNRYAVDFEGLSATSVEAPDKDALRDCAAVVVATGSGLTRCDKSCCTIDCRLSGDAYEERLTCYMTRQRWKLYHRRQQVQSPHANTDIVIIHAGKDDILIPRYQVRVCGDNLDDSKQGYVLYCTKMVR